MVIELCSDYLCLILNKFSLQFSNTSGFRSLLSYESGIFS